MKQGQRLNLKFSIADVDFIVGLAKAGRTAEEIRDRIGSVWVHFRGNARSADLQRVPVEIGEILSICWQSGVKVRASETV